MYGLQSTYVPTRIYAESCLKARRLIERGVRFVQLYHGAGNKWDKKTYTWYTGYTGQKSITARDRLERHPERILREAVRRMLPKSKLGRQMLSKLKIYVGGDHPHQAQEPERMELPR